MPNKTHTLSRQWALLNAMPSAPRRLSTAELHQRMRDEGFGVDVRSIQRTAPVGVPSRNANVATCCNTIAKGFWRSDCSRCTRNHEIIAGKNLKPSLNTLTGASEGPPGMFLRWVDSCRPSIVTWAE